VLRFGLDNPANVSAVIHALGAQSRFTLQTADESADVTLQLPGRHNVQNALAAATLALALGVPLATIKQGLESAMPVSGRMIRHEMAAGWTLIDDSYNANPGSTAAAIATLVAEPGEAWLVLGDMRELGADAPQLHAQIGTFARERGVARLYTVGPLSAESARTFGADARHFADQAALIDALAGDVHVNVRVLVKGSRGSAMDRVVRALLDTNDNTSNGGARHVA
jgi:UDP-N-acetylmuramoyl-tripeptide--D-alanyl-D-alanine ligase